MRKVNDFSSISVQLDSFYDNDDDFSSVLYSKSSSVIDLSVDDVEVVEVTKLNTLLHFKIR